MQVNLMDLINGRYDELVIDTRITLNDKEAFHHHQIVGFDPFTLKGKITAQNDQLAMNMHYEGTIHFICDRCLTPFSKLLTGDVEGELSTNEDFNAESLLIRDGQIDLKEALMTDLVINLPIQMICSDDCEGLCKTCGVNLNEESCECENDSIDPRLESLKGLFN